MDTQQAEVYYHRYITPIRGIARKFAGSDDALMEDLVQEGCLALMRLDPSKARVNENAWIRQALKHRMVDFLRKYRPQRYESLDARFESGDQLERLEDGELLLRSTRHTLPNLVDPDELEHP